MAATTPKKKRKIDSKLLDGNHRAERSVPICLRADLQADYEDLERQLVETQNRRRTTMVDGVAESQRLVAEMEALRAEMTEATVEFRLRALPRRQWAEMRAAHPPTDPKWAWNVDTLAPALIRASTVDPEVEDVQWQQLLGEGEYDGTLTEGQYTELLNTVLTLNAENPKVPFSLTASVVMRGSAEKSKQPSASESLTDA